jgi:folylpolyglutamate synthase/dihydropteroate synthase
MLFLIQDDFDEIYFTEISTERTATLQQLKEIADKAKIKFSKVKNISEFLNNYLTGEENNCLVITGSMYLLGDVKSILSSLES